MGQTTRPGLLQDGRALDYDFGERNVIAPGSFQ